MREQINTKELYNYSQLVKHIHNLMEEGNNSKIKGWSMKRILEIVYEGWGQEAFDSAYKYIKEDYCGIKNGS